MKNEAALNVLILSASSKTLLVRAFQEALHSRGGRCVAVDIARDCAALAVADAAVLTPPTDDPCFADALFAICRAHDIRLVVPTRDGELRALAGLAPDLRRTGVDVLIPAQDSLRACQSTRLFAAFCQANGFRTPETYADIKAIARFPVFCRADDRTLSHPAMKIADRAALEAYWTLYGAPAGGLAVQDHIDAPEYSVDVLMDLHGRPLQAVARRRIETRAGESWKSRVEDAPALTDQSMALCEALGLVGHITVQAFYSQERGPVFIEVNPRFGGGSNLSIRAGLASAERILQMLDGRRAAAAAPRPIAHGALMLRHAEDIIIDPGKLADTPDWRDLDARVDQESAKNRSPSPSAAGLTRRS
ncbi:MAG: ATP-grasp domain-containing protein [Alphaproteobacteria bacterium]|nr:ATP-grasp domain-containing protein [Alphaproteobacteria bacterium]